MNSLINPRKNLGRVLPVIVISLLLCTSLWFAGNAVMPDLIRMFRLSGRSLGYITSAVQLGFIVGTLVYALSGIADRFSPSKIFSLSALVAAFMNMCFVVAVPHLETMLLLRFLTGFFLAGVYPVGMKIASDYYETGLGKALGFLVGALVIGTALPHLLKAVSISYSWKTVLAMTSAFSVTGSILMLIIPDGPYRMRGQRFSATSVLHLFRHSAFRSACLGYFGHMWELYAFWAFVPVILNTYAQQHPAVSMNIPFLSFLVISLGSLSCVSGGYLSMRVGARKTAFAFLLLSGLCCCISPLAFYMPPGMMIGFLIFWGLAVIGDSPLFSTIVAQNAPPHTKGTALSIVTCIGFSLTIVSIELLNALKDLTDPRYLYLFLAPGPALGLFYMRRNDI